MAVSRSASACGPVPAPARPRAGPGGRGRRAAPRRRCRARSRAGTGRSRQRARRPHHGSRAPRSPRWRGRTKSATANRSEGSTRSRPACGTRARSAALDLGRPDVEAAVDLARIGRDDRHGPPGGDDPFGQPDGELGLAGRGRAGDDDQRRSAMRHSTTPAGRPAGVDVLDGIRGQSRPCSVSQSLATSSMSFWSTATSTPRRVSSSVVILADAASSSAAKAAASTWAR